MEPCEDCGFIGERDKFPACGDYHSSGYVCCYKFICQDGCRFVCPDCGTRSNKQEYSDDGWYYQQICESCDAKFVPKFLWWGLKKRIPNEFVFLP